LTGDKACVNKKSQTELKKGNIDDLVKNLKRRISVIPAKAGIQLFQKVLDPGFRRGDAWGDFLRDHQY